MNLIYDQAARAILKTNSFIQKWNQLHSNCHYATAFQEPAFVGAWYEAYQDKWKPLIVFSENSNGELKGLLLLAYDSNARELVHAGSSQAEYHSWISLPGEEAAFLSEAFRELLNRYDFTKLRFRYFPAVEILEDVISKLSINDCIEIRRRPRPLMNLNAEEIKASFAKKSNKSRFNRLKKLGKVDFYRIKDLGTLNNVFDDFIAFYDLRQGAINYSKPFHEDVNKRKFHVDLFERAGEKAYVTVTCLNDRPIAGFWGLVSHGRVHLGMLMHSPFLAEHSIGKLHLMQLSEQLLTDGFDTLDLTPGSDPWKERFANAHDEVAEVIIYRSRLAKVKGEGVYKLLNFIRNRANRFGFSNAELKSIINVLRGSRFSFFRELTHWIRSDRKFLIYQVDQIHSDRFHSDARINLNSIGDLILFEAKDAEHSVNSFLSNALYRLEEGEQVFTMKIDHQLMGSVWMKTAKAESDPDILPPDGVIVYDFFIAPDFHDASILKSLMEHVLSETLHDEKIQRISVILPSDNQYFQAAEQLGMSKNGSFIRKKRFGKERVI